MRPTNPEYVSGQDWWTEPRGWRDVVRCLLGMHRASTTGFMDRMHISRCSCGAIRINHRGWFDAEPFTRRRTTVPGKDRD